MALKMDFFMGYFENFALRVASYPQGGLIKKIKRPSLILHQELYRL